MMRKTVMLTLLCFAVAAFAGCGKKAPPRAPEDASAKAAPYGWFRV